MDDKTTLAARVPIGALADVERFIQTAQHLKALTQQLHALRHRDSRRQAVLAQQINTFTQLCGTLALASPRLAELWTDTQSELVLECPESFPLRIEHPRPDAPAAAAARGAGAPGNGSSSGRANAISAGKPLA